MSKVEILKDLRRMLVEMRPILVEAGINLEHYELPEDDEIEHLYPEIFTTAFNWLLDIRGNQYAKILGIKELLPEEIWERYKKWEGFEEHREVVMLNTALRVLKAHMAIHNRPDLFCKTKVTEMTRASKAKQKAAKKSHPRFLRASQEDSRTAGGAPETHYTPVE